MITKLNAFNISVRTDKIISNDDPITELSYNDDRFITLSDMVYMKGTGWYRINQFVRNGNEFRCLTGKRNESMIFLCPFLFPNSSSILWTENIMNTYLYHEDHPMMTDLFWMVYRRPLEHNERYSYMKRTFMMRDDFAGSKKISDDYEIFTFSLKHQYKRKIDIDLFKKSRFSEISKESKALIYSFHNIERGTPEIKLQLERNQSYRKKLEEKIGHELKETDELRSSLYTERETFKISDYTYDKLTDNVRREVGEGA